MLKATDNKYYDFRSGTTYRILAIVDETADYVSYHGFNRSANSEIILHRRRDSIDGHFEVERAPYKCRLILGQSKGMEEHIGTKLLHTHPAVARKAQGQGG